MTHLHHVVPKSRGGADEQWNLTEVDPYTHAYEHALDFVLFDYAPRFDFRHEAWPILPEDLQKAVRNEASRRQSNRQISDETLEKMRASAKQREIPWAGKEHLSEEHKEKISKALQGKKKTPQHIENFRKAVTGRKAPNKGIAHSEETKRKIAESNKGRTPWNKGLTKK